jgi:hypothetical protein
MDAGAGDLIDHTRRLRKPAPGRRHQVACVAPQLAAIL